MKRIYVVGTADTKGEELTFLADTIAATGRAVVRVDVGTRPSRVPSDISAEDVAAWHPDGAAAVLRIDDRGAVVAAMGAAFARLAPSLGNMTAIIYAHNPNVTLMRTTPEGCVAIGSWIGERLSHL